MFSRVRDSLVYPKEILKYRKDRMIFVILYLLFFAALLSTRTIIDVVKYDGLSAVDKEHIEEDMPIIDNNCAIISAKLSCDGEHIISTYDDSLFTLYLDSHTTVDFSEYPDDEYSIIINDESVYVYVFGINSLTVPLSDFPISLQNIDFNDQVNNPNAFYNNLFSGIDELIVSYKDIWGTMLVLVEFAVSISFYLLFLLFSAWFLKKRYPMIPFKETFTMTVYSSTSLYIILTFYSMLDLSLIIIIILLVISFRQNSIMNKEIDRRIRKIS